MARTLKRQRARALRDATAIKTTYSTGAINEELWAKLEEALLGLLDIQTNFEVMDVEHLCPKNVQLVLRLDLIRAVGAHDKVEIKMQRVMDALGVLCVIEEGTRADPETFWTRLLTSHVMRSPWDASEDERLIEDVVAFARVHSLQIVLSWEIRKFQSHAAHAIGAFLQSPRRKYEELIGRRAHDESPRLVCVGLRFRECQLSARDLVLVTQALAAPELTSESDFLDVPLCGVYTLRSLEFHDIKLSAASLKAIADGLASAHTRRVDALSLEKVIQLTYSPEYVPAFKRLLAAALQAKHTEPGGTCTGLKLSLAGNDKIQPVHVEALQEALAVATRPLCALNLTDIPGRDVGTWLRLGQIFFTPIQIECTEDCELIISHLPAADDFTDTLSLSLGNLVGELLPRVAAALQCSVVVQCRALDSSLELSPHETYQVMSVRTSGLSLSGWLLISTPSAPETSTWVDSSSISYLRIGDEDVVCSRITRLITQNVNCFSTRDDAAHRLVQFFGNSLRNLSLRNYLSSWSLLPGMMDSCPNVRGLDLQNSRFDQQSETTIWDWMTHHPLEMIDLYNCGASVKSVNAILSRLLLAPHKMLRFLDLGGNNNCDTETLDLLLQLLQANRSLLRVEMPWMRLGNTSPDEVALRIQLEAIDDYLHAECLSPGIKMAFLGVVRRQRHLHFDESIVRTVFEFTGIREKRVMLWDK